MFRLAGLFLLAGAHLSVAAGEIDTNASLYCSWSCLQWWKWSCIVFYSLTVHAYLGRS